MALDSNQISDILFKKIATGKATTVVGKKFFEEPFNARPFVDLSQIWVDSILIPIDANTASPVVEVITRQLTGTLNSSSFYSVDFKNIIPFNYGDGLSYQYKLYNNSGVSNQNLIPLGLNDWYFDTETGVLTFFGGVPPGVTTANGPYMTVYLYTGRTAKDTGMSGDNGPGSAVYWLPPVLDIKTQIPLITPTDGDRYLLSAPDTIIKRTPKNGVTPASITPGYSTNTWDIVEYVSDSPAGWEVTPPLDGYMLNSLTDTTAVYQYYGGEYNKQTYERTYEVTRDSDINCIVTTAPGAYTGITISYTPTFGSSTVDVLVNGVRVKLESSAIISTSVTKSCYFSPPTEFGTSHAAGRIVRRPNEVQQGDHLFWMGSLAGYELDGNDTITLNYVTSEEQI